VRFKNVRILNYVYRVTIFTGLASGWLESKWSETNSFWTEKLTTPCGARQNGKNEHTRGC